MNYLIQVFINEKFGSPFGPRAAPFEQKSLGGLISLILTSSLTIAGLIVFFMFAFAGFSMIMGAGNNNPEQAAKGKKAATMAVVGFVIIFSAYWIIQLIEVITGYTFITNPGF